MTINLYEHLGNCYIDWTRAQFRPQDSQVRLYKDYFPANPEDESNLVGWWWDDPTDGPKGPKPIDTQKPWDRVGVQLWLQERTHQMDHLSMSRKWARLNHSHS